MIGRKPALSSARFTVAGDGVLSRALLCLLLAGLSPLVDAGAREQARRMHDRLAGVPPSAAVLDQMTAQIAAGNPLQAAMTAMESPDFYRVTLKNFVTPWTNRDGDPYAPLNDYTATVIGLVRDDADFRRVLYDDVIYVANSAASVPAYRRDDNAHYIALESQNADLKAVLESRTQSSLTGLRSDATAGVLTTRGAAKAFFIAGTNRAMLRFTLMNHLCQDLEQLKDGSRPPDRIRQDVTRSPGGDSRLFLNNCSTCHAGMDPLAQAFAYYDFQHDMNADPGGENGQLVYNDVGMADPVTGTRVVKKYLINSNNFKYGFATPDDRWDNYWRKGVNQWLGWDGSLPGGGNGAKSLGRELAHSQAFAQCQVEKVFRNVCLRTPTGEADKSAVQTLLNSFQGSGYKLKTVFAETARHCMGD